MIKVLFFGVVAQKTGCHETEFEARGGSMRLSELIEALRKRFEQMPKGPYMLAINQEQAGPEMMVNDGDEVAVMPPFSGG